MLLNCGVGETLESPLDCKEIKPVNPEGNQPCIFIGSTDAEATILWPPDGKSWLIRKDRDAGKDWRQKEKGTTEDEMVGWCNWFSGTWVWASFGGRWWMTGKPAVLQSMGSERVRHHWETEQQQYWGTICAPYNLPIMQCLCVCVVNH